MMKNERKNTDLKAWRGLLYKLAQVSFLYTKLVSYNALGVMIDWLFPEDNLKKPFEKPPAVPMSAIQQLKGSVDEEPPAQNVNYQALLPAMSASKNSDPSSGHNILKSDRQPPQEMHSC